MIYGIAVSFGVGIFLENYFHVGWSGIILASLLACVSALMLRDSTWKGALLIGAALIIGILRMDVARAEPDVLLLGKVDQTISLTGFIAEEPDLRDTTTRYIFKPVVENKKIDSKILLTANSYPTFAYGNTVTIRGKLQIPKNFESDNGYEFDYVSFLAKDQIHFTIFYPEIELVDAGTGVLGPLFRLKTLFLGRLSEVIPEPNSSLLGGLLFGAKQSLGRDLLDDMRRVGLIHIVVLSGYNLTIIASAIFFVTSRFRTRSTGFLISSIAIALFAVMVGLGATVVRASIMALIAILARYVGRPNDALRALTFALIVMLLWNPALLLYDPSFQLSFMATLGLILFTPFVSGVLIFIPEKYGLREIISSTLAVQIFILPLLIKMSGSISLISFVVNPIVLPFIPYVMLFGFATGLLGFISTLFAWIPGVVAYLSTEIIFKIVSFASSLPFSTASINSLPTVVVVAWYSVYALGYLYIKKRLSKQFDNLSTSQLETVQPRNP